MLAVWNRGCGPEEKVWTGVDEVSIAIAIASTRRRNHCTLWKRWIYLVPLYLCTVLVPLLFLRCCQHPPQHQRLFQHQRLYGF